MVVDDEIIQIESIGRGLRSRKIDVVEALSGEEALMHFNDKNNRIEMILTDYAMPGMNGLDLLRRIREKDRDLPVIIMTGYGDKNLVINAMRSACDSFIEKPFTLEILMDEINRVMPKVLRKKKSRDFSEDILEFVHQINNPLFSISAGAELSLFDLEKEDTGALKDRITRIIKATEKITEINRKIRDLGQGMRENTEDLYISGLLNDCILMFEDMLNLKQVSVKNKLQNDGIRVSGVRFEMEQVFKNLILNAIEAMDGMLEKNLEIGSHLDPDSGFLSVYMKDTGCGIPARALERIFSPYFTTKENGTGLGLAVIKGILEKHQGMIDVKSVVGQGTRFDIRLKVNA
jgi:signal transduction histidine kinase